MDNSKEYIKMCEKAEEIQEFKSEDENWVRGDYFSKSGTMHIKRSDPFELHKEYEYPVRIFLEDMYGNKIIDNDYIWLPRQDQLQILSGLSWQEFDKECLKYDMPTKEQTGLKVVLKLLDKTTQ